MGSAFVYAAARTPFGRFGGALAGVRPDDLAATAIRGVLGQGCPASTRPRSATSSGATPTAPARTTATSAGWPCCSPGCRCRVPGTTVNRLCGSQPGRRDDRPRGRSRPATPTSCVAGGVESMTRAPVGAAQAGAGLPGRQRHRGLDHAGLAAGQPADAGGVDGLARRGQRAAAARSSASPASGRTRSPPARTSSPTRPGTTASTTTWWSPVAGRGPGARRGRSGPARTPETLAGAASRRSGRDGTITAGNASPLNDGASAVLLGSEAAASRDRRATRWPAIAGRGAHRARAAGLRLRAGRGRRTRRCARAGIGWADVGAVELNEAFAVQSLACVDAWKIDPEIVNTKGGAIAIGHPLGASGGRDPRHAGPACCASAASGGASPRSASASARAWPWCSRTSTRP